MHLKFSKALPQGKASNIFFIDKDVTLIKNITHQNIKNSNFAGGNRKYILIYAILIILSF